MGEYVKFHGEITKIGTCEDLYYARYQDLIDNLPHLSHTDGNLQPSEYLKEELGWRYRFPFPREDGVGLGNYKDYDAGYQICVSLDWSFQIEHRDICVSTSARDGGYNVNHYIKCPGSKDWVQTCSNRCNPTPFEIIQQKQIKGNLWTVIRCSYCDSAIRLDREEAAKLCRFIRQYHWRSDKGNRDYANEVIRRIIAGYNRTKEVRNGNRQKITA